MDCFVFDKIAPGANSLCDIVLKIQDLDGVDRVPLHPHEGQPNI